MPPRYEARPEADGTWTVFDRATGLPAIVNDVPQLGHDETDARDVARELQDLMGDGDGEE